MKKVIYTVKTKDENGTERCHYGAAYKKLGALAVLKEAGLEIIDSYDGLYELSESDFAKAAIEIKVNEMMEEVTEE